MLIFISFLSLFLAVCSQENISPNKNKIIHLTNDNFVSLRGPVTSTSIADLIANLLDKTSDKRYIYINTNGGSVDAGLKLINVIKDLENIDIEINCIADTAISMGFVIFQSCTNRYLLRYSTLMQHQISLRGVGGKILELNSYMTHINMIENNLNKMQADRINMTQEAFEIKIMNDWWLTTEEAIENNVGDDIVSIKCMFPKEKEITEINTIFGDIVLTYMKCPQVSSPIKVELKLFEKDKESEVKNLVNHNFIKIGEPKFFDRLMEKFIDIIVA